MVVARGLIVNKAAVNQNSNYWNKMIAALKIELFKFHKCLLQALRRSSPLYILRMRDLKCPASMIKFSSNFLWRWRAALLLTRPQSIRTRNIGTECLQLLRLNYLNSINVSRKPYAAVPHSTSCGCEI